MSAKSFLMGGACVVPVLYQADRTAHNSRYGLGLDNHYGELDGGYHVNVIDVDDLFGQEGSITRIDLTQTLWPR